MNKNGKKRFVNYDLGGIETPSGMETLVKAMGNETSHLGRDYLLRVLLCTEDRACKELFTALGGVEILQQWIKQEANVLIVSVLNALPITREILKKTRVGVTINNIAKSTTDSKLKYEASNVVLKWRN